MQLRANSRALNLSSPKIMGILNCTPDSFSDSGKFLHLDNALFQIEKMLAEGADIIDIGGESTRPMAKEVSLAEELQRVIPIIEAIQQRFDCWLSVDTSKSEVMSEAAKIGVDLINDIRALQQKDALSTVAKLGLPVCLMHMQGQPCSMQQQPIYSNVVEDVLAFLQQRTQLCLLAGIRKENIIWDVGFGFGKTVSHNYLLLKQLDVFTQFGFPVLVGLSRKSMLGAIIDKPVDKRTTASVVAAMIAVKNGASILRVHDVAETREGLKILQAVDNS